MITYQEIDRLVVADDAVAARLWPRLGPKVRGAYTNDRDAWVALRRKVEQGATLPPATLNAQHRVFAGWARAFHVAAGGKPKHTPAARAAAPAVARTASATAAAAAAAAAPAATTTAAAASLPAAATTAKAKGSGGAGTAVAGLLVLAGITAAAATRKRA